jgi:hypothetical protein
MQQIIIYLNNYVLVFYFFMKTMALQRSVAGSIQAWEAHLIVTRDGGTWKCKGMIFSFYINICNIYIYIYIFKYIAYMP